MQLLFASVVYGYMNPAIFQLFGVAILLFEVIIVFIGISGLPRMVRTPREVFQGELLFFGFILGATLVAVGLICLHRWAAVTASIIGVIWSIAVASAFGHKGWPELVFGAPVAFAMLVPLYATIKAWPSLKPVGEFSITSSFRDLRSSEPLHLK